MSWRPKEGWEQTKGDFLFQPIKIGIGEAYEAGADALLKALRADGFHLEIGQVLDIEGTKIVVTKNQTLVIIPDDD